MSETLHYQGYDGSVEYSAKDRVLHGRILGIRDVVTFEGADVTSLEQNFKAAIGEYLAFCKEQDKSPNKPFSGTFNVRTGIDLHRRAALYAEAHRIKLNSVVKDALERFFEESVQDSFTPLQSNALANNACSQASNSKQIPLTTKSKGAIRKKPVHPLIKAAR